MRRSIGTFAGIFVLVVAAFGTLSVRAFAQSGDAAQGLLGFYRYPTLHG